MTKAEAMQVVVDQINHWQEVCEGIGDGGEGLEFEMGEPVPHFNYIEKMGNHAIRVASPDGSEFILYISELTHE